MLDMNCMIEVLTSLRWKRDGYISRLFSRGKATVYFCEEYNAATLYYFGDYGIFCKNYELPSVSVNNYCDFAALLSYDIVSMGLYDEEIKTDYEWVLSSCEKENIHCCLKDSDENEEKEENMSQKKEYAIVMKCQCCGEWTLMCAEDKDGNNGILVFDDPYEAEQHALQFYDLGDFWIGEDVGDGFEDVKGMKCNDIAREKYENE